MQLSEEEVRHVARLASLDLDDEEVRCLTQDLSVVLAHVQQLNEVDTEGVPPTTALVVDALPFRDDKVQGGLSQATATGGAARSEGGCFSVPAFVEEG